MLASRQGVAEPGSARLGLVYGLLAYGAWGFSPLYYKLLIHLTPETARDPQVNSLEVLAHRVIWSVLLLLVWLWCTGDLGQARVWRRPRLWAALAGTTCLIAINWGTFVYAVAIGQVTDASLGYFINPLVSVLLGYLFLGERLRGTQVASVALAASGVAFLTWSNGSVPVIALTLAFSFGFYGMLRKIVPVEPRVGLLVEVTHLLPLALGGAWWLSVRGEGVFLRGSVGFDLTLALCGVVTVVPLFWFTLAARRLRLATVGFMQYLAPTGQLLLAVLLLGEAFDRVDQVSFSLIWLGLALYSVDAIRFAQRERSRAAQVPLE